MFSYVFFTPFLVCFSGVLCYLFIRFVVLSEKLFVSVSTPFFLSFSGFGETETEGKGDWTGIEDEGREVSTTPAPKHGRSHQGRSSLDRGSGHGWRSTSSVEVPKQNLRSAGDRCTIRGRQTAVGTAGHEFVVCYLGTRARLLLEGFGSVMEKVVDNFCPHFSQWEARSVNDQRGY